MRRGSAHMPLYGSVFCATPVRHRWHCGIMPRRVEHLKYGLGKRLGYTTTAEVLDAPHSKRELTMIPNIDDNQQCGSIHAI
jgi:hypothetical protein